MTVDVVGERAASLFRSSFRAATERCDRVFARVFVAQWIFAVVVACVFTPFGWAGREQSVHVHVWFALFIGGALTVGPLALIAVRPGWWVTRHVVAVAQMLWSALLIHLTGGRIETHFHVFGSLAFLAFYRDWRVLLTATVVVSADHLVRGLLFPASVYGIVNPEWWRFLEHAGWVGFEDIVLVISIVENTREMQAIASSRAQIEALNASVEQIVEVRTAELAASKEQYRTLVEDTNAVPWIFDKASNRFTYIAPQTAEVLDIAAEHWLKPGFWQSRMHKDDVAHVAEARDLLQQTGSVQAVELRLKNDHERYVWVRVMVAAHHDTDAVVRGILVDVTDHRTLEAELQQAQKLSAIGALAAGIAHEINTPIQYVSDNTAFLSGSFNKLIGVVNAASAVLDDPTPAALDAARAKAKAAKLDYLGAQVPRAIDQTLEGLRRVSSIVSAMKDFSHPSKGEKAPVSLRDMIETTATVARNEWKYVADLDIDVDAKLPPVTALRDELSQVLLNMIVNAAHAIEDKTAGTDRRGRIKVSAHCEGGYAEIRVADDGNGIPDDVKARVFEPFFTTKPIGKGTGQGLAIAWSVVVDKHGGTVTVESEVGVGSTFIVRLPMGSASEHAVEEATLTPT